MKALIKQNSARLIITVLIVLTILGIVTGTHQGTPHPSPVSNPGHSFDDLGGGTLIIGSGDSLIISGEFKVKSGAAVGRVLTSDAAGFIGWADPISSIVGGSCAVGTVVASLNNNGSVNCIPDGSIGPVSCPAGQAIFSIAANGSLVCASTGSFSGGSCSAGQVVTAVTSTGVTCGTIVSNKTCSSGQAVTSISSGGSVTCSTVGDNLGNHTATANLNMDNRQIRELVDPINTGHAVRRGYTDTVFNDDVSNTTCSRSIRAISTTGGVTCNSTSTTNKPCIFRGNEFSHGFKCIAGNVCSVDAIASGNNRIQTCTNAKWVYSDDSPSTGSSCEYAWCSSA